MTKRGRPYKSQPETNEASKHRRVEFEEAIDDVIPIALAQKLRHRLAEEKAETSSANEDVEKKKPRGKKADHLYCRQNPTEFISCIQSLMPRQKESVNELGFGAVLDINISPRVLSLPGAQVV
ncbi:uncharacterized protein LOC125201983 isoform X2 [Salvia hispanica]|uniref:uncharacterized protein LOC125201983 isoform X2 n=1 Tax=Salvia hispanica TaxID=49212 RepID=UPI00200920A0|nr:uncharacterized protein LOC125201983 isoform X2 [Salvia hispanica]